MTCMRTQILQWYTIYGSFRTIKKSVNHGLDHLMCTEYCTEKTTEKLFIELNHFKSLILPCNLLLYTLFDLYSSISNLFN